MKIYVVVKVYENREDRGDITVSAFNKIEDAQKEESKLSSSNEYGKIVIEECEIN